MKAKLFTILVLSLFVIAFSYNAQSNEKKSKSIVKVVYFHGDYRCPTCNKLEEYSKETLEKFYNKELKSGDIIWKTINYDKEENKHYLDDFKLYNKALLIFKVVDGEVKEWKNLEKIWEKVNDQDDYLKYVKNEIDKYRKG